MYNHAKIALVKQIKTGKDGNTGDSKGVYLSKLLRT